MKIGCPKEQKISETRVGLNPELVSILKRNNHQVLIESGAGLLSGFRDEDYEAAGAEIIASAKLLWESSDLVVKVKEPQLEEFAFFRPGLILFCFLHPAAFPKLVKALVETKVTALSFDLLKDKDDKLALLKPMSEVAGKLATQEAASLLQVNRGGKGLLFGGAGNVRGARVLIVGGGVAGEASAKTAVGMGARTLVLDINLERLNQLESLIPGLHTKASGEDVLREHLPNIDVLVGSVLLPGKAAPKIITEELLELMPAGSLLVDICIDQGGFSESSRPTTLKEPTYVYKDITHYCVANIPALVPQTSTACLCDELEKWLPALVYKDIDSVLTASAELKSALVSHQGKLVWTE